MYGARAPATVVSSGGNVIDLLLDVTNEALPVGTIVGNQEGAVFHTPDDGRRANFDLSGEPRVDRGTNRKSALTHHRTVIRGRKLRRDGTTMRAGIHDVPLYSIVGGSPTQNWQIYVSNMHGVTIDPFRTFQDRVAERDVSDRAGHGADMPQRILG
jgi:hypothetical protein